MVRVTTPASLSLSTPARPMVLPCKALVLAFAQPPVTCEARACCTSLWMPVSVSAESFIGLQRA
jgi:hypothetical protein